MARMAVLLSGTVLAAVLAPSLALLEDCVTGAANCAGCVSASVDELLEITCCAGGAECPTASRPPDGLGGQLCQCSVPDPVLNKVPGPVTNLNASPGDGVVILGFAPPVFWGEPDLSNGQCQLQITLPNEDAGETRSFTRAETGGESIKYIWRGLRNDVNYEFGVQCQNNENIWSEQVKTAIVRTSQMSTPQDISAILNGDGSVTVAWTPPKNKGGGSIEKYQVLGFKQGDTTVQYRADTVELTATLPEEGSIPTFQKFEFSVKAINSLGIAGPLSPPSPSVLLTEPSKWQAESWQSCLGAKCGEGETRRIGQKFRNVYCEGAVTLKRNPDFGCDGAKPITESLCELRCPQPPTNVVATPFNQGVTISFTDSDDLALDEDADLGYDPITAYYAIAYPGGYTSSEPVVNSTYGLLFINGLDNDEEYTFSVRSRTESGLMSEPSEVSPPVTPQVTLDCNLGRGCVETNGICYRGLCDCHYGFSGDDCGTLPLLNILEPIKSATVDYDIKELGYVGYQSNVREGIEALLLRSTCTDQMVFCVPAASASRGLGATNWQFTFPETGDYYVRLFASPTSFNDTGVFKVTDAECVVPCGAGVCRNGDCVCPAGFYGPECAVEETKCQQASVQCGTFGTCDDATLKCKCSAGFSGEKCQYGPACQLKCQHGGIPYGDKEYCRSEVCHQCDVYWEGPKCETCGLTCSEHGTKKDCETCVCEDFYTGDKCNTPYVEATIELDLDYEKSDIFANEQTERDFKALLATEFSSILPTANSQCTEFRATNNCRSDGPRDEDADLICSAIVPDTVAGYCRCGGSNVHRVECGHEPFSCIAACHEEFLEGSLNALWVQELKQVSGKLEVTLAFHGHKNGVESRDKLRKLVVDRKSSLYQTYIGGFVNFQVWGERSPPKDTSTITDSLLSPATTVQTVQATLASACLSLLVATALLV